MNHQETIFRLLQTYAYRFYPDGIKLASGKISNHYFNAKEVLCRRDGGLAFATWALDVLSAFQVSAVGGLEIGAIPPAAMISVLSPSTQPLDSFIVRKKPKEHGLPNAIEGALPKGGRVAIIEDVVTSGGSALQAIQAVEAAGAEVAVVIALLDRQEEKRAEFLKYPLQSAITLQEFLSMRGNP
jgi:orotate phosphoribosyltransferase